MSRYTSVAADAFGVAFDKMLSEVGSGVEKSLAPAVKKGCNAAKRETVSVARAKWPGSDYPSGFSYHVERNGYYAEGEVGNETKPGLVHLLEKGHAIVGGERSRAFPHVDNGYSAGSAEFQNALMEGISNAL